MATDVLKVPGDYKVIAKNGDIIFDLYGTTTGTVRIYGNLDIFGTSTYVVSTNTFITDKIIVLNYQENSNPPEPTGNVGGILIDSFSGNPNEYASILFNYDSAWSNGLISRDGVFEFKVGNTGSSILTNAIRIDPGTALVNSANTTTLNFLGAENPNSVLSVSGTYNYEINVIDDDDIPNKKYVDDRIYTGTVFAQKLQVGNSFIEINDNSVVGPFYNSTDRIIAALSNQEVFRLEGSTARIQGLMINNTTVEINTFTTTATSIALQPLPGGKIVMNGALTLVNQSTSTFAAVSNQTTLYYSEPIGGGGTGLHFVNSSVSDELVSRRKAIIYGIIF
jgi:hypothetical protein